MKATLVSLGILAIALCGCGKDSGHNSLSAVQIGKVNTTLDSIGQAELSGWTAQKAQLRSSNTADDEKVKSMASRMLGCQISGLGLPQATTDSFEASVNVTGNTCPVDLKYSLSANRTLFGATLTQNMSYKVTDPDFRRLNDVDSFSMAGKLDAHWEMASSDKAVLNGNVDIKGAAHSQQYGDIKIAVAGQMTGEQTVSAVSAHSEETITLSFADFSAQFKRVADSDGKTENVKYYLNDDELTEAQYKGYLQRAGTQLIAATFPGVTGKTR